MTFVMPDDAEHLVAVSPHDGAVLLRIDPAGQGRRIDEVDEHDCQTSDLAVMSWGRQ